MKAFYKLGCSTVALSQLLFGGNVALAQVEQVDAATQRDEIIATASRREQVLQDVPFAVTAINGAKLEELGASGFETIATRVPGLQSYQASPLNTQFFIRGVTSGALGLDQVQQSASVGIYFSEVSSDLSAMNPNFLLDHGVNNFSTIGGSM